MEDNLAHIELLKDNISLAKQKLEQLQKELLSITLNTSIARYKDVYSIFTDDVKICPFIKLLDKLKNVYFSDEYINFIGEDGESLFSAEKKTYGDDITIRYRYYTLSYKESYGMDMINSWFALYDIFDPYTEQWRIDEIKEELSE